MYFAHILQFLKSLAPKTPILMDFMPKKVLHIVLSIFATSGPLCFGGILSNITIDPRITPLNLLLFLQLWL